MLPVVTMALALVTMVTSTEVTTTSGPVRGAVVGGALRFLGIPYAKPPLGALRFSPPVPPEPWSDVRDATEFGPVCVQPGGQDMSEDCLTLNIYLPQNEVDMNQKRAVMVYIHGGALLMSSGKDYDLSYLATTGDVIGVTMNYRLGVLGFFTTGDDDVRGNAGLFDQQMALLWVRENIGEFGGDTSRITIFGESSGGQSVSAHVLSPLSEGLFQRAISQSGVFYTFPAPHYTELKMAAQDFAKVHGCSDEMPAMLKCLRLVDPAELIANSPLDIFPPTFSVVVDGEMVTKPFSDMWGEWTNPHGISYMAGVNSDDGDSFIMDDLANYLPRLQNGISEEVFTDRAQWGLNMINTVDASHLGLLRDQYLPGGPVNDTTRLRALLDLGTDGFYLAGTIAGMDATARLATPGGGQAYLYYFSHVTLAARMYSRVPDFAAGHGRDLAYLFGGTTTAGYTEGDRNVTDSMITAWTSFAKTGSPMYVTSDGQTAEWPPYTTEGRKYLEIKGPMTSDSVKARLRPRAAGFWNVLLPAKNRAIRGYDGSSGGGCKDGDSVSRVSRDTAETLLFILVAVVIVLLLATAILLANYCSMKKAVEKNATTI